MYLCRFVHKCDLPDKTRKFKICIYKCACIHTYILYMHTYIHVYIRTVVATSPGASTDCRIRYVYIHACIHIYMHACIYTQKHIYMRASMFNRMRYVCMHIYIHTHKRIYMHASMFNRIWYVCMHIYIHTCVHTHVQVYVVCVCT